MSKTESNPSKFLMPVELRLGRGKDGLVDIKGWKRELKIYSFNFFGRMAMPIEMGEYPDRAKPKQDKFIYRVKEQIDDGPGKTVESVFEMPYPTKKDAD